MNPFEFNTLVRAERELWWFRGMQRILFRLLDSMKIAAGAKRVLEAGCGTGYFAGLAERRYGWQVFPADLSWEGLSCAHKSISTGDLPGMKHCLNYQASVRLRWV